MSYLGTDELIRALQKYDIIEALQNKDFFALEKIGVAAVHFVFTNSDSIELDVYMKDYNLYTIELTQEEFKKLLF